MSPFTRKAKLKLLFTYTQRHIHRMHVFPTVCLSPCRHNSCFSFRGLDFRGKTLYDTQINPHTQKHEYLQNTAQAYCTPQKTNKQKEINTMHSCVQKHTYAYRNTSYISNSQNSLRRKHLKQTSRWMDMHYVVQNGFFDMVWHCGTICDLLTI